MSADIGRHVFALIPSDPKRRCAECLGVESSSIHIARRPAVCTRKQSHGSHGACAGVDFAKDFALLPLPVKHYTAQRAAHERAIAGMCSHGGHGYDGETCSDIDDARAGTIRYPDVTVELIGHDGNAFAVLGRVVHALRLAGVSDSEIHEFMDEAKSSDYNHLLATVMQWVEVA